jgi:hypothetical protein
MITAEEPAWITWVEDRGHGHFVAHGVTLAGPPGVKAHADFSIDVPREAADALAVILRTADSVECRIGVSRGEDAPPNVASTLESV